MTPLREQGVLLLRDAFPARSLSILQEAAIRCFEILSIGRSLPAHCAFNPYSHSVLLTALTAFGCASEDLLAPLSAPGLGSLFSDALGPEWQCKLHHSWVRKKFAPRDIPSPQYRQQNWHQDGALGVRFPPEPGPEIPITELLTCWIPLNPCGLHSPGLEFVRGPQPQLLHFTELGDSQLRLRFPPENFWAPALSFGDALIFLNSVLHRTHARPEMSQNRLSVEYRLFPAGSPDNPAE